jgi:hypothetical protein
VTTAIRLEHNQEYYGQVGSLGSTVARTRDRVHRSLAKCNMELAMGEVGSSAHLFLQKTGPDHV